MISSVLPFSRNLSHVSVQSLPTYYFISLETKKHDYILWFNAHMRINHSWGVCVCVWNTISVCVSHTMPSLLVQERNSCQKWMIIWFPCPTVSEPLKKWWLKKKRTITKSIFENGIFSQRYLQFSYKITRFCPS